VSHGGLAVALAEMVTDDAGADVSVDDPVALFDETPGRVVVETDDPDAVRAACEGVVPVDRLGDATGDASLRLSVGDEAVAVDADGIREWRGVIERELD